MEAYCDNLLSVSSNRPFQVRCPMALKLDSTKLDSYIADNRSDYEKNLKRLVDIPSVSMDPAHKKDIDRLAAEASKVLEEMGGRAEVFQTEGNPVIVGTLLAKPEDPTVLIYNHMDVQPADPAHWDSAPFEMAITGDKYLGRGTTDDKGPALTALYAARFARQNNIPLNIKIVWELEEEIGSGNFFQFLRDQRSAVESNSIVVSDTVWISREKPAIPCGFRGLLCALIKLETGTSETHSGLTGGGARNPYTELVELLSLCVDAKTGAVKIPGFYQGVEEPTEAELDGFIEAGFTSENFMKAHKLKSLRFDDAREVAKHIWTKPTFEVHGITGGYEGPGVKTIIPPSAEAKVSMRLVPGQNPEHVFKCLEAFVKENCPEAVAKSTGQLGAYAGIKDGKYIDAAREAIKEGFGSEPALVREGGSIGAVVALGDILAVPIVFLGLSLPEHGYHSVNENFDWGQASGGMKAFVKYFEILSTLKD